MQAPRRQFLCPKFEIEPLDMAGSAMQMVPAPHLWMKQLLVLRAQGHQESLQSENKVKFSQRVSESRYWTNEERQRFKKALKTDTHFEKILRFSCSFGTDFAAIAKFVGTRSSTQVRTHAQKYYAKLIRDYKRSGKAQAAAASGVKDKSGAANARIATESSYIRNNACPQPFGELQATRDLSASVPNWKSVRARDKVEEIALSDEDEEDDTAAETLAVDTGGSGKSAVRSCKDSCGVHQKVGDQAARKLSRAKCLMQ
ncbi:hypothetical protein SELMODRAFT_421179 [Selaginella moellendorffii]|uniref:Myb-like domain-containing protein n=1 Tax=Selaginella moellendorffii TaxID=88036 RepID=D8SE96_SELML|nr:hypothetical protein SELMODRAFT_421179 [Selaginella moellendorffii]